ncbi:MAG: hypothetical protein K2P81_00985 [Bacteriovoracaceae bacterium]|nr:hypothetical protein [Bacteriovoracaceae bacterium]
MKNINPGVAHLRQHGFIGAELSKRNFKKQHDVTNYGLIGGIKTDVDLQKTTIYRAGKGPGITFEALYDQESGSQVDSSKTSTVSRETTSDAKSTYLGGNIDFKYFGISYAKSKYNFLYKFRAGDVPTLSAHDIDQQLDYTNMKIGTAFRVGFLRVGLYYLNQKSTGDYAYSFYDPSTGNKGSTENYGATTSANGYGVGLGSTFPNFRIETSLEKMSQIKVNISDLYPGELNDTPASSRLSVVGELKFTKIAFGFRARQIKGNFYDLEDIISANLLYKNLTSDDSRLETTFNFGFGISKGFSFSGFYTQSKITTSEVDPISPSSGDKYDATTNATAMGLNLSYVY